MTKVFNSLDNLPAFKNAVVTIGTFDGVHSGHRKLFQFLRNASSEINGESVVITFWPHPRMVLHPEQDTLRLLNTIEEKIALLETEGIDNIVILPFTLEFSKMNYADFVREVLVDKLHTTLLIVGHDHHFGKDREGSLKELEELSGIYSFKLIEVPPQLVDDIAISSSKIRNLLSEGDVQTAYSYLGYYYNVSGLVVHGDKIGRELGYPTANIELEEKYKQLPGDGIYTIQAIVRDEKHGGMASIGFRPTVNGTKRVFEVNLFDFDKTIYGEKIKVFFLAKLRNEVKFANLLQLAQQMSVDKVQSLEILNNLR